MSETPLDHQTAHQIALARELTYAAGVPLRDRYGYAACDEHVRLVLDLLAVNTDDDAAANAIGLANALHDVELANDCYDPIDEDDERRIVAALRPLVQGGAA